MSVDQAPPAQGTVRVANEVIATIAAMAAREVEGVAGMDDPSARHLGDWLKRQTAHDGVRVVIDPTKLVTIDTKIDLRNFKEFARTLVDGVLANRERLDALISEASSHWRLDQMGKVDRAVLRIAVYEIAIDRGVPVKAAINESIELAKTFSGEESGRFVNGVLGKVAAGAE